MPPVETITATAAVPPAATTTATISPAKTQAARARPDAGIRKIPKHHLMFARVMPQGMPMYKVINTSMCSLGSIFEAIELFFRTKDFKLYQQYVYGMTLDNWGIEFKEKLKR
jgi:hypothetical protein